MRQAEYLPEEIVERYRRSGVRTRSGETVDDYIDLRSALLDEYDQGRVVAWFRKQLEPHRHDLIIGTGAFGAGLCVLLMRFGWKTALWNPKDHGIEWSGYLNGRRAVFVDDVVTTGETIALAHEAAAAAGISIVRTVVAWDRRVV